MLLATRQHHCNDLILYAARSAYGAAAHGPIQGRGCLAAGRVIERTSMHTRARIQTSTHTSSSLLFLLFMGSLWLFGFCCCFCPCLSVVLQTCVRVSPSQMFLETELEARFNNNQSNYSAKLQFLISLVLKNCFHVILKSVLFPLILACLNLAVTPSWTHEKTRSLCTCARYGKRATVSGVMSQCSHYSHAIIEIVLGNLTFTFRLRRGQVDVALAAYIGHVLTPRVILMSLFRRTGTSTESAWSIRLDV